MSKPLFPCVNPAMEQPWLADVVDYSLEANLDWMRREDIERMTARWEAELEGDMNGRTGPEERIHICASGPGAKGCDQESGETRWHEHSIVRPWSNAVLHGSESTGGANRAATEAAEAAEVQPETPASIDRRATA